MWRIHRTVGYLAVRGSFATWLYDAQTGEVRNMFPNQSEYFHTGDLTFSSDGNTLAVGMLWGIDLWNVTTGNYMKTLTAPDSGATLSLAFLPLSFELASGHSDGTVKVWNTNTNGIYKTFTVNADPTTEFLLDVSYVFQGQIPGGYTRRRHSAFVAYRTPKRENDKGGRHSSSVAYGSIPTRRKRTQWLRRLASPHPPHPPNPTYQSTTQIGRYFRREYEALRARYNTLSERYSNLQLDARAGVLWVLPENPIGVYIRYATRALVFFDPDTIKIIREGPPFYFSDRIYRDYPYDSVDGPIGDTAMRYLPDEEMLLVWSSAGCTVFASKLATGESARLAEFASHRFSGHRFVAGGVQEEAPPDGRLIVFPSHRWSNSPSGWHVKDRKTGVVSAASPDGGTTPLNSRGFRRYRRPDLHVF